MKDLSSDRQASILNDSNEAVKRFSWETVRLELYKKVPTNSYVSVVSDRGKAHSTHPFSLHGSITASEVQTSAPMFSATSSDCDVVWKWHR